jgi:hypothetical protein
MVSSQRDDESTSQEGEYDWPHDQPDEMDDTTQMSFVEMHRPVGPQTHEPQVTKCNVCREKRNVDNTNEFKAILDSVLATIEINNRELRDSIKRESKENIKTLQEKLEMNTKTLKDNFETNNKTLQK